MYGFGWFWQPGRPVTNWPVELSQHISVATWQ